ncbi:ATP-binding protein [Streptomyces coeruleorubidus]|uniref:ATP-binding protein n=1 Tax=Streptomyces coeruleorubidus TaxID=116188 RepID=UPI001875ABC1|nr:ATP-binding protein [Streptomyces bellus]GGT82484.1 hypothetical protein GCM10010244_03660 [Streptomyces bellus]
MADLCDPACLALTELVANVVRHTPDRRAAVLMTRRPDGRGVRVEVTDTCPLPQLSTAVDELSEGGRGGLIVGAVTDRWGGLHCPAGPARPSGSSATRARNSGGEFSERNLEFTPQKKIQLL